MEQSFKDRWIRTKGRELFLVVDNAKYNHGKLFKEHLEKITQETDINIKVIYLPAYSPNLNLIERLWKYSKKKLL